VSDRELARESYPLIWHWRKFLPERKGQRCRTVCRGSNGNSLLEFEDGWRTVAPWRAARRA
jgi:hypothetical protein